MPHAPAPSPAAYTATVTPFDLQADPVRKVRLSARQVEALGGLTVPITFTAATWFTPTQQAEVAIQDAIAAVLKGRLVSAVLWRDPDLGDVSVWHDDGFLPIATVELAPPRTEVAA